MGVLRDCLAGSDLGQKDEEVGRQAVCRKPDQNTAEPFGSWIRRKQGRRRREWGLKNQTILKPKKHSERRTNQFPFFFFYNRCFACSSESNSSWCSKDEIGGGRKGKSLKGREGDSQVGKQEADPQGLPSSQLHHDRFYPLGITGCPTASPTPDLKAFFTRKAGVIRLIL